MFRERLAIVVLPLLFAFAGVAHAQALNGAGQDEERAHRAQGYFFFAPGAVSGCGSSLGSMHAGGGFEVFAFKGVGIGAEAGYLAPWKYMSDGIGLASINGSYHFSRSNKLSPFVTAGYSIGFRSGHANMINFGGGVNYWLNDRAALRMEFRDHVEGAGCGDIHYLGVRLGLSLR